MLKKDIIPKVYNYLNKRGFTRIMIRRDVHTGINHYRADMVVYFQDRPIFIIEVKSKISKSIVVQVNKFAKAFKTNYFLITNGEQFKWYKTGELRNPFPPLTIDDIRLLTEKNRNKRFKKSEFGRNIEFLENVIFRDVQSSTEKVYNDIFEFLYKKHLEDNNFLFRVRKRNIKERLDNGYWFIGNDNYLVVSMWLGNDWHNKTPYIYFHIDLVYGNMELIFVTKTSDKVHQFAAALAPVLGLEKLRSKEERVITWHKVYYKNWEEDYLDVLEKFINTEKVTIDNAILVETKIKNNDLDGLDLIDKVDFNKSIERIWQYRDKPVLKNTKPTDYTKIPIVPKTLFLQNIGHYKKVELDVSAKIICLFGENGIGKTTLLRAFLLALTGVDETALIDTTDVRYQRLLHIQDVHKDGTIQYAKEGSITLTYHHHKDSLSKIDFKLRDNQVQISDTGDDNLPSFTTTLEKDYYTQLIIGFAQVQGRHKNGQVETVNPIKRANVRDILPLLQDVEDNRFEDLSDWILDLYGESVTDNDNQEKEILERIFEIITEITETSIQFEKVKFSGRIIWVRIKGKSIPFRLLSQGYKNVFAWIGHFIKRLAEANNYDKDFMRKNAILVIDEIDTYLHPKWQRNILNVLAKRFPNTRFIVTTHSPLVANYLEEEDKAVYLLKEQEIEKVEYVYGRELSYIFRRLMSIEDRPKILQDKIDILFDLLDEDTPKSIAKAKVLFKELSTQLSEDDGDLIQAKTYLELGEE